MGKYKTLGTLFNRIFRNDLNQNFDDIDKDIQAAKKGATDAEKRLQGQVDALVISGDSSPAAAQAAVDSNGVNKGTLKKRLDDDYNEVTTQLAESTMDKENLKAAIEYGEIKLPSDFPALPFFLYRDNDGRIKHSHDMNQYKLNLTATYYVSKSTGLDTNNGTSEATPLKTIKAAYAKIGSNQSKNYLIVVLDSSIFMYDEFHSSGGFYIRTGTRVYITTKNPLDRIISTSGVAGLTWTATGGYTNVYQTTHTANLDKFIDLRISNRDYKGLPKPYKKVNSIAEVNANVGSYYVNGMTIYVKTIDGVQPDNIELLGCVGGYNTRHVFDDGTTLVLENVDCFSGNFYTESPGALKTATLITNNCRSAISIGNGFGSGNLKRTYHFNGVVGYVKADGFNYGYSLTDSAKRREYLSFEYNCTAYECGFEATTDVNNASTTHDGVCILRVGTTGYKCKGPVCADVNGSYSILYDCNFRDSVAVSSGNHAYTFNNVSAVQAGKATLINCSGINANGVIDPVADTDIYLLAFKGKNLPNKANIYYL